MSEERARHGIDAQPRGLAEQNLSGLEVAQHVVADDDGYGGFVQARVAFQRFGLAGRLLFDALLELQAGRTGRVGLRHEGAKWIYSF